jgi:radical SAM-linked protein
MRVRFRHCKLGKVRFTSHRDVARIWERALRRTETPVAYTEGFSPRPKLSFGLALSTGHESLGEYLDVELDPRHVTGRVDAPDLDELSARLTAALPVGIDVQGALAVAPGTPSLQQAVTSCTWQIEVDGPAPARLADLVAGVLARDEIILTRSRKGHEVTDDLRPLMLSLAVTGQTPRGAVLMAELGTQPRGLRPAELLQALGDGLTEGRVCRTHQWMHVEGARQEPLPLDATSQSCTDTLAGSPPGRCA